MASQMMAEESVYSADLMKLVMAGSYMQVDSSCKVYPAFRDVQEALAYRQDCGDASRQDQST
jgi:hypothetical protein